MSTQISYKTNRNRIKKKLSFFEGGHQLEKLEFALAIAQTRGDEKKSIVLRKKIVEGLSNYLNNDSLKHMITKSYSMDEIVEAHKTMEGGSLIGNIIINI